MPTSDNPKPEHNNTEPGSDSSKPSFVKKWFSKKDTPEPGAVEQKATQTASDIELNTSSSVDKGLEPSRNGLLAKIGNVFKGNFDLNDQLFEDLEDALISSDIGLDASIQLIEDLQSRVKGEKIQTADGVIAGLAKGIEEKLQIAEQPLNLEPSPYVVLVVGVNGVGKTTTTAKIANHFKQQGKSVMLAAADTFRAAAVEQLQEWGARLSIPVIAQSSGADAAAVAHDALSAAKAKNIDILLIDTAGRLHTQTNLMEQLQKVNRVLKKLDPSTPHEVIQVLDACTGQNALSQLEHFQKAVSVTSLCVTKLDGSAKGGVIVALTDKFSLPIRFIGVGEAVEDLKPFKAQEFANALLSRVNRKEQ